MSSTEPSSRAALVTGGAGFIGHHLVRALLADGWSVVVLDDLSTGRRDAVPEDPRVRFIEGSILDPRSLGEAVTGVEALFHLAAQVSVASSVRDPQNTHRTNTRGTREVIEAACGAGVRSVVFASSCSVYGEPSVLPVAESADPRPQSPYADSKLEGERFGYERCTRGPGFAALRLFNVYGPGQPDGGAYAAVIAAFAAAAGRGEGPRIFGDGHQTRDFVHVDDVVAALVRAAEHVSTHGTAGPFNVGTGRAVSLLELWDGVAAVIGTRGVPAHSPQRSGDIVHSCADVRAIQQDLGWTATMGVLDGLRTTFGP